MTLYRFRPIVFQPPYAPHYDSYKGHRFCITKTHPEANDHVWLECVDDPTVKVNGFVEMEHLQKIS